MKKFIRNYENEYLVLVFLVLGILMVIFPEPLAKVFPWVLGIALLLNSFVSVIHLLKDKHDQKGPGKAILCCIIGLVILIRGNVATGIIGVIWAVYSLVEVSEEINEMWKERHYPVIRLIAALISIMLAVMLMVDPNEHFITHVRVLGLEILSSCCARGIDLIREKTGSHSRGA